MKKYVVKCWKCGGKGNVPYEEGGHPHASLSVCCDVCKGEGKVVMEVIGEIVDENPQVVGIDIATDRDYAGEVFVMPTGRILTKEEIAEINSNRYTIISGDQALPVTDKEYRAQVRDDHELDPYLFKGRSYCGRNPVKLTEEMIASKPKVKK